MASRIFLAQLIRYHGIGQEQGSLRHRPTTGVMAPILLGTGGGSSHSVRVITDPTALAEDRASGAAFLGGLATLILSGGLAYVWKTLSNTQKELEQARKFRQEELPQLDAATQRELKPIVDQHIEILESKAFYSRNIRNLTLAALSSAGVAFLGGMFAMQGLITAAIIAGVATAALAIFTAVWYAMDDSVALPQDMQQKLLELRARA